MPKIGGIGLPAKEFKAMVEEVTEEGVIARQAAYDTVMEVLAFKQTVTPEQAQRILAQLSEEQQIEMAAFDTDNYRQLVETAFEEAS